MIAYYFHQNMIDADDRRPGGRRAREQPRLYNLLENLCISRGITMPKLKVMDSEALNAFATGMNEKQYSITVTSGLLDRLDDAEIESVLGHELTHIRNGDVRMMVVAVIIAGVISFFAELVFRLWILRRLSRFAIVGRPPRAAAPGLAILIADRPHRGRLRSVLRHPSGAVAVARIPRRCRLGGTHQKSRRHDLGACARSKGRGELPGATSAVMEMCIDNPRQGFGELFDTHPSVERRVAALVKFAGGHDPGPIALPPPGQRGHRRRAGRGRRTLGPARAGRRRLIGNRALPKQPVRPMPGPPDHGARTEAVGGPAVAVNHITGKHAAGVAKARANILTLSNPEPGVVEPRPGKIA